jgi:RND family efflux transporter MFP subunit
MRKIPWPLLGRIAVTLVIIAIAVGAGRQLWTRYQLEPWTRDGRVRADVVQIAPDVGGLVTKVSVQHDQEVKRGDVLFVVDPARYRLALQQADAAIKAARANLDEARREVARNEKLGDLVPSETLEQSRAKVEALAASLDQAQVARSVAALNLQRTVVRSPTDGYVAEASVRVGDYASPGRPMLAVLDKSSLRVEGYFEETKLPRIFVGQKVRVQLMGEKAPIFGHVQSIATGIEDRDRQASANLLPNINPTFSWVRLAQRAPVRISLDRVPADLRLIAGRTATVEALSAGARP